MYTSSGVTINTITHTVPPLFCRASLKWRANTKPEEITWDDVAAEGATGKQYVAGQDNQGPP